MAWRGRWNDDIVLDWRVVFVKTHNALPSVSRMTQTGSRTLRKTVVIVIKRSD